MEEWKDLIEDLGLIDEEFTMCDAEICFLTARMKVVNEADTKSRARLMQLGIEDFLEAFVRVAYVKPLPSKDALAEAWCEDSRELLFSRLRQSPTHVNLHAVGEAYLDLSAVVTQLMGGEEARRMAEHTHRNDRGVGASRLRNTATVVRSTATWYGGTADESKSEAACGSPTQRRRGSSGERRHRGSTGDDGEDVQFNGVKQGRKHRHQRQDDSKSGPAGGIREGSANRSSSMHRTSGQRRTRRAVRLPSFSDTESSSASSEADGVESSQSDGGQRAKPVLTVDWARLTAALPVGRDEESTQKRRALFNAFDTNSNGTLSLSEIDRAMRNLMGDVMGGLLQSAVHSWSKSWKKVIMRSFQIARDSNSERKGLDRRRVDFVERDEFRVLLICMRQFFELYIAFCRLDLTQDHRIELDEFKSNLDMLHRWGAPIDDDEAEEVFRSIDTNKSGAILFDEFCLWALVHNLDLEDDDDAEFAQDDLDAILKQARTENANRTFVDET
jgi:Ca2+-binding EF-hand superfamily protein